MIYVTFQNQREQFANTHQQTIGTSRICDDRPQLTELFRAHILSSFPEQLLQQNVLSFSRSHTMLMPQNQLLLPENDLDCQQNEYTRACGFV